MGLIGYTTRTTKKLSPWARALAVAELALLVKRHLDRLGPGEGIELRDLIVKSKGRPGNLTQAERSRIYELVRKLEPGAFAKSASLRAVPIRRR